MLYSTHHNKNTNEDPKTSVVFENLLLFPDNIFWEILKNSAANKNILPENAGLLLDRFEFWPRWDSCSSYDTGNSIYVEPDIFFRFEKVDVIVEAKYSDISGQYREEWEREFKAYLNEYENDNKTVVLLAVGGNSTFTKEPELKVGNRKCPIVKYSWASLLDAVLDYEKRELTIIKNDNQSSIKRIVRNTEIGFNNIGIYKYKRKVEIKGLSSLYILGKLFHTAIKYETELYSVTPYKEDMKAEHYGYQFRIDPKDGRRKQLWMSIALWINEQEVISIEARNEDNWAGKLCKIIEDGKKFTSKYAVKPYAEGNSYYFDAKEKLYEDFESAGTFDAQVEIIRKYIDDICVYYLK